MTLEKGLLSKNQSEVGQRKQQVVIPHLYSHVDLSVKEVTDSRPLPSWMTQGRGPSRTVPAEGVVKVDLAFGAASCKGWKNPEAWPSPWREDEL